MKELEALEVKVKSYIQVLLGSGSSPPEEIAMESEGEIFLPPTALEDAHYRFEESYHAWVDDPYYEDYGDVDYINTIVRRKQEFDGLIFLIYMSKIAHVTE